MTLFQAFGQFASSGVTETVDGMVLLTPSAVTVGSGSATISTNGSVEFTNCSTVQLEGIFSATYDNYFLRLRVTTTTANRWFKGRWVSGSTPDTASNYTTQYYSCDSSPNYKTVQDTGRSDFQLIAGEDTGSGGWGVAWLFQPYTGEQATANSVSGSRHADAFFLDGASTTTQTTSYDGLFLWNGLSENNTGEVAVYGMVK